MTSLTRQISKSDMSHPSHLCWTWWPCLFCAARRVYFAYGMRLAWNVSSDFEVKGCRPLCGHLLKVPTLLAATSDGLYLGLAVLMLFSRLVYVLWKKGIAWLGQVGGIHNRQASWLIFILFNLFQKLVQHVTLLMYCILRGQHPTAPERWKTWFKSNSVFMGVWVVLIKQQ